MKCVGKCFLWAFATVLCLLSTTTIASGDRPDEVSLGRPRIWGHDRIYPLLDGLFQDVASTQLAQLTLNPNTANAASLNAVQNAFQLGVSYSATLGVNTATAAQQNQAISANNQYQTRLIDVQSQITQSYLAGEKAVASAQDVSDRLAARNAPSDEQAAAASALKMANDNLNVISAELTTIKGQLTSLASTQQLQAPSTSAPSSVPTLPSALLGLTQPPNTPSSPSFPASKQMDNQLNLLWERLARVVGTLANPDSQAGDRVVLMQTDIDPTPRHRKKQLLSVTYMASCADDGDINPIILDLFPSASAVNIIDTKYRENRIGLAAVLSWFTVGLNASYNRDHLMMTQALGQSAYITGFGIGRSKFGWMFGPNLGDDEISPGNRRVFALIGVPSGCKELRIDSTGAGWVKRDGKKFLPVTPSCPGEDIASCGITVNPDNGAEIIPTEEDTYESDNMPASKDSCDATKPVTSISYAPVEYDPAVATHPMVSVTITTCTSIDPEQVISIEGRPLKRSRDNFGRGINSGGAGGLLETGSIDSNSWLPVNSREFTLSLDPGLFDRRFPAIQVSSPHGSFEVSRSFPGASVYVGGVKFDCATTCPESLPPLGLRKATTKQVLVAYWQKDDDGPESLLITALGDQNSNPSTLASGPTPSLQVISSDDQQVWGNGALVMATESSSGHPVTHRLACLPMSARLSCEAAGFTAHNQSITIDLYDADHAGGPIRSWKSLSACDTNCNTPIIWQLGSPTWRQSAQQEQRDDQEYKAYYAKPVGPVPALDMSLKFPLKVINSPNTQIDLLASPTGSRVAHAVCNRSDSDICDIELDIPASDYPMVSDDMVMRFSQDGKKTAQATIGLLLTVSRPLVNGVNDDQTVFTGQNLYFRKLRVGDQSKELEMSCSDSGLQCHLDAKEYGSLEGFLDFTDGNGTNIPVLLSKGGVLTPIFHAKPAKTSTSKPVSQFPNINIDINNNTSKHRLYSAQ